MSIYNVDPDATGHVYTLRLQNNCYYVGWSAQVEVRIAQHFLGRGGAKWTQLHPPTEVLSVLPGDRALETATTIACMCQHGWQFVRGAAWCQVDLKQPPAAITKALSLQQKPDSKQKSRTIGEGDHVFPWSSSFIY